MKLLPPNKDLPVECWQCKCRHLSIQEGDKIFEQKRDEIKQQIDLKEFSYDKENNRFVILTDEWEEDDRLISKRKRYPLDMQERIVAFLKKQLEQTLEITLYDVRDVFIE